MLKNKIEQIRQQNEEYGSDSWAYNISGGVLELSVCPPHPKTRVHYRDTVIQIGRVLKKLSDLMMKEGSPVHVQTFPNLEDPSLVASVRISKKQTHKSRSNDMPGLNTSLLELMKTTAEHQSLAFEQVPAPDTLTDENNSPEEIQWYLVSSDFDNPFVWLKIGYWLETIHQYQQKDPKYFLTFYFNSESTPLFQQKGVKNYPQVWISVKN